MTTSRQGGSGLLPAVRRLLLVASLGISVAGARAQAGHLNLFVGVNVSAEGIHGRDSLGGDGADRPTGPRACP